MIKATPTKNKPARKTKRCKSPACKKPFTTANAKRKFCTTVCQQLLNAAKRKSARVSSATRSAFFYYLVKEVKRAATLQILQGHTPESLAELHKVYKESFRVNQYGDVTHFQMSHIAAVKGANTLGLLHAENLVISPTELNKAHGVKHYGAGKCISRTSIHPRHSVDKDEPDGAVLDRLIAYLGEDVVAAAVKLANIKPTDRQKNLAWLRDHLDATNPDHRPHIDSIESMKGKQLKELRAELEHKLVREFGVRRYAHTSFGVLRLELERHSKFRPQLGVLSERLSVVNELKGLNGIWDVRDEEEQALFDLLHGRDTEDLHNVLDAFVIRNTPAPMDDENAYETPFGIERICDYTPISIPLWAIRTDAGGVSYMMTAPY